MKEKKPRTFNKVNRDELKKRLLASDEKRATISFYKYFRIAEPSLFRDDFYLKMAEIGVLGRVYVAAEGINGQISVPEKNIDAFRKTLFAWPPLDGVRLNFAREDDGKSFFALDVKVRPKIVADGIDDPDFDPSKTGQHLTAKAFNELTSQPQTLVVDMRNHYETEVGHFENAILPLSETFREQLPMVVELLAEHRKRPIVMYCTGGIRCEKASAFLRHNGFENVFQLEGGIIEYDRQAKAEGLENRFLGKNFVFDDRRGERIGPEIIARCHQCGSPSDDHQNCANDFCHLLFIQCPSCREKRSGCCSALCQDFSQKPLADQKAEAKNHVFTAAKHGPSGHYRAAKSGELLH